MKAGKAAAPATTGTAKPSVAARPSNGQSPLTAAQRNQIRDLLLKERAAALRSSGSLEQYLTEATADQGRVSGDVVDVSNDFANRENATMLAHRNSALVRELDARLKALEVEPDLFDRCQQCDNPIGFGRLEFLPTARTCRAHAAAPVQF